MQHYEEGGSVPRDFLKEPVRFGNVTDPVDINGNPLVPNPKDTRSDSEKAEDYLMGKGPNPFLFYHDKAPTVVDPVAKAAEATKEIAKIVEEQRGGGGQSFDALNNTGKESTGYVSN